MERLIEIKLPRCLICLTEGEMLDLLKGKPEIWEMALRRGKGIQRQRQAKERNIKYK